MLWLALSVLVEHYYSFRLVLFTWAQVYAKRVYMAGLAVVAVAVLGLLANPFIPPPIAAAVPRGDLLRVAQNLAAGSPAPFKTQMYYMFGAASSSCWPSNQRFNVLGVINSLGTKMEIFLLMPAAERVGKPRRKSMKKWVSPSSLWLLVFVTVLDSTVMNVSISTVVKDLVSPNCPGHARRHHLLAR